MIFSFPLILGRKPEKCLYDEFNVLIVRLNTAPLIFIHKITYFQVTPNKIWRYGDEMIQGKNVIYLH